MKIDRLALGCIGMVCASAVLVTGCSTTAKAPAKQPQKARAAKPAQPPAKPKLAVPQLEKPAVAPVAIAPFDWQSEKIKPVKRADVLAAIEKKDRPDDFDGMIQATDMDGKQLAGFLAAVEDRLAKLAEWEKGDKAKRITELRTKAIPAAQEGTDEAKLKALAIELNQLDAEYGAFRVAIRAMVMGVMNLEQQRAWAGRSLLGQAMRGMRGVKFDADQQKKALAISVAAAAKIVKADTVAGDPYLNLIGRNQGAIAQVADKIKDDVLTKEQKAALSAAK